MSNPQRTTRKGKASLWFQLAFGAVILVFVGALLASQTISFSQRSLPHNIAGLPLTESMAGDDAKRSVNQLHGLDITLQDAWIGHYGGQRAIVWISVSPTENDSAYLMSAMIGKIKQGNAYFGDLREMTIDGQKVYSMTAQDKQQHYVWQVDRRVIWIAAPAGKEMPFLQEAMRSL